MKLKDFIKKYYPEIRVKSNQLIDNFTDYDKEVKENDIFISINNNINYINNAINKKASVIVYNNNEKIPKTKGINYIGVDSPIVFLARLFKEKINELEKKTIMIGITGTSGKTSSSYLLYHYLKKESYDVLYVGTHCIYSYYGLIEVYEETNNTTISLSMLYNKLHEVNFDYDYVIMEVSSEGIMNNRVLGLIFDVVSVTNITSDHLNYHKSMEAYVLAKEKLLYQTSKPIILNYDDEIVKSFNNITLNKVISYGINKGNIKAKYIEYKIDGTSFIIYDNKINYKINTNLLGTFNVYNILNVWSIIKALNLSHTPLLKLLNNKITIPGRMNIINKGNDQFIVDYAHTIEEVKVVLNFINKIKNNHKVITIIGCGGNRDTSKRPIIGELVTNNSDYVIFTEDNNRSEKFINIIDDIIKGCKKDNYQIIEDRKQAISYAYQINEEKKVILVLGKGNEKYIIKNNIKYPYSDINTINELYG